VKKVSSRQFSAALLSGLLLLVASPGPIEFAPVAWCALLPLLLVITNRKLSSRRAGLLGLCCGMTFYPLLLYWIVIVLGRYGNLSLWLSVPAMLLLAFYMSLYLAAFAALTNRLQKSLPLVWVAPFTWVAMDYLRGWLFTGLPWFDLAYSQFQTPLLIQVADLTGHYGLSFMIVMVNALILHAFTAKRQLAEEGHSRKDIAFRAAVLLIVAALSYNLIRFKQIEKQLATSETFPVAVVQGNFSQDQKWLPQLQRHTLDKYLEMSLKVLDTEHPRLIVWPETAIPFYLAEAPILTDIMVLTAARPELTVLTGAPFRERSATGTTRYFNSAFFIDANGLRSERYDKQHLVPFGEYVPLKDTLSFLAPLVEAAADFSPGEVKKPVPCNGTKIGTLICFESIFPDLSRQQTRAGASLLVNLTNDAWYGRSSAPWQHLSMAVFRSVENRRSLTRSANTGVSGFIDPLGRMHDLSPLFEDYTAFRDLPISTTKSFFVFGFGHLFGPACLVITLLMTIMFARTRNKFL
jgi:apolipoprotein N-acyltransferase